MCIGPVQAEAAGELVDDDEVLPRLAGSGSAARPICTWRLVLVTVPSFSGQAEAGRTTSASVAVSVRKRSWTTRWSSFASAGAGMRASGSDIAGFSPMMYMPVISPRFHRVHDLDHGEARGRVELRAPELFQMRPRRIVVGMAVVGKHHRDQPGIGGALDVVLATQRVQPGARPADLAAEQREGDQAAGIVGAVVDWLMPMPQRIIAVRARANSRATRRSCSAGTPQSGAMASGVSAATCVAQRIEVFRMRRDILPVVEPLLDHRMDHRVQHRHVAAGREAHHLRRMAVERTAARVERDQRRAARRGLLQEGGGDRVVLGRPGADDDDDLGLGAAMKGAVTAPEPMPSSSAATEAAWQSRVQWSTLLVPKPVRTSFWNR